jgi:hypothetical protein
MVAEGSYEEEEEDQEDQEEEEEDQEEQEEQGLTINLREPYEGGDQALHQGGEEVYGGVL